MRNFKKLQGIVPPVVTPLKEDGSIDTDGLKNLLEHLIKGGVHGLFILGSTGEGPALGIQHQKDMIRETIRINQGRLPVLAGISNAALEDTLDVADYAAAEGADALVCAPPSYFALGEDELAAYYKLVAEKVKLPLFLYNMPAMTKITMKPALVKRLAEIPNIRGYKDSSGLMCDLHEVILALGSREDFSIFVGPEELLAEAVLFGADGGIAGGANIHPELFVRMYNAAKADDLATVRNLQQKIYQQRQLYSLGRYQSSIVKGIKCALACKEICRDTMVLPFDPFHQPERKQAEFLLNAISEQ